MPVPQNLLRFREVLGQQLPELRREYKVAELELFGSFVRQENHAESDLDVLVAFSETPSLIKLVELENHLTDLLGVKVDLVMRDSLKQHIGERVRREAVPL